MAKSVRYQDCDIATMQAGTAPYGLIEKASLVIEGGQILWLGKACNLPERFHALPVTSLNGRLITPAFVDCHTHLIFGGNRALEFEMRLQGASYEEIARRGGGIISTVKATREATDEELLKSALTRLDALMDSGVSVVEVKSGYGLTIDQEIRMLRIARALEQHRPVSIVTTWLAAHAVPPEYKGREEAYIDEVVIAGLKLAHSQGLVDAVDGFCETIGFSTAQMTRIFKAAKSLGLPMKLHAEQLTDQKGAILAAEYQGLSADHLEYLDPNDVPEFAKSGSVAVLLPGAFYTLKETQLPPVKALRDNQVDMAIATDCNPGSSPLTSILTAMNMACTLFSFTPEEALTGVTRHAAKALGLSDTHGVIAVNRPANIAIWDVKHPSELSYWLGASPLHQLMSSRALT
ncbi:imidazolonepropionase [Litorimonas taeanensis]|uniref:Imidazolonepropionase n=1 Tax=Litorimonas taeanensis TaxID=568099 RepID=A0A420WME2_9PROT|nr:imidazolonepropionase [Litorimonas taeanensis]RKQ72177.1 imidazolonepropionase [Litorimonas taeanensis]